MHLGGGVSLPSWWSDPSVGMDGRELTGECENCGETNTESDCWKCGHWDDEPIEEEEV